MDGKKKEQKKNNYTKYNVFEVYHKQTHYVNIKILPIRQIEHEGTGCCLMRRERRRKKKKRERMKSEEEYEFDRYSDDLLMITQRRNKCDCMEHKQKKKRSFNI